LGAPEVPLMLEAQIIVNWFFELDTGRGGSFGPDRLQWSEIKAWADVTGRELTMWNLTMLRMLDSYYLKMAGEQMKKEMAKK